MRRITCGRQYGAVAGLIRPSFPNGSEVLSVCLARTFIDSLPRRGNEDVVQAGKFDRAVTDQKDGRLDRAIGQAKELQARTPWHREDSDKPPVRRNRRAGAMTKGKLLTTPSRLLKLILPLTTLDKNVDRKSIEPLALLVHPQQPLSYLERLIQSELPTIPQNDGSEKVPEVHFRAEDASTDETRQNSRQRADEPRASEEMEEGSDEQMIDGKLVKLGKINKKSIGSDSDQPSGNDAVAQSLRGGPGEGGIESYSGRGRHSTASQPKQFVRWSASTEIGEFIRDAARGKEFAVEIEGSSAPKQEIMVGVPSFNDRTHYLRIRLRKASKQLTDYTSLKKECDQVAHKSAQRIALGGFGILLSWWCAVYYFTFLTDYGWDVMEPITYEVSLTTLMLGYLWFLYHNREVSYRSALEMTVSRRQHALYEQKGFDPRKWETLIHDANALRREIKAVAEEYDVDWDEKQDIVNEEVHKAMREQRDKTRKKGDDDDDDEDDNDCHNDQEEADEPESRKKLNKGI